MVLLSLLRTASVSDGSFFGENICIVGLHKKSLKATFRLIPSDAKQPLFQGPHSTPSRVEEAEQCLAKEFCYPCSHRLFPMAKTPCSSATTPIWQTVSARHAVFSNKKSSTSLVRKYFPASADKLDGIGTDDSRDIMAPLGLQFCEEKQQQQFSLLGALTPFVKLHFRPGALFTPELPLTRNSIPQSKYSTPLFGCQASARNCVCHSAESVSKDYIAIVPAKILQRSHTQRTLDYVFRKTRRQRI